jgi:hypothetical protein
MTNFFPFNVADQNGKNSDPGYGNHRGSTTLAVTYCTGTVIHQNLKVSY